jgi:flagellar basal body-associated protein FliL
MKRVLFIVLGLVLLAGAGGGGYYYFVLHGDARAENRAAEAEAEPDEPIYVEFNPILLPILGEDRVDQFVNIVVALEFREQAAADRAIALAPRLNDAYLRALYGTLHTRNAVRNGVVDLQMIKARLVEESNAVLGDGVVRDALVQMVSQRIM